MLRSEGTEDTEARYAKIVVAESQEVPQNKNVFEAFEKSHVLRINLRDALRTLKVKPKMRSGEAQ